MRKKLCLLCIFVMLSVILISSMALGKEKLTIITWPTYTSPELISDFEDEYSVEVEVVEIDDPVKIVERIMEGNRNYDLVINDRVVVNRLINSNGLMKLDKKLIPNFKNIDPMFMGLEHDPTNSYSVPYHYVPMGLMFNADKYNEEQISLQKYFEPDGDLKGEISLYPDKRLQIGLALKYMGKSLNSRDSEDLELVKILLENLKKNAAKEAIDMDRGHYQVSYEINDGKADLGIWYYTSADLSALLGITKNYGMKVPSEGTKLGMDVFGVVKTAENKELAHKFINYFYNPKNAAKSVNYISYPVAVLGTKNELPPEVAKNVYLPSQILVKSEFYDILSTEEEKVYDKIWSEVFGD